MAGVESLKLGDFDLSIVGRTSRGMNNKLLYEILGNRNE